MATEMVRTEAQRWQAALERAIDEALDVLIEPISGEAFIESATHPGTLYAVSAMSCSCPAGQKGQICKHRACYLATIGELPLDSEPDPQAPIALTAPDGARLIVDRGGALRPIDLLDDGGAAIATIGWISADADDLAAEALALWPVAMERCALCGRAMVVDDDCDNVYGWETEAGVAICGECRRATEAEIRAIRLHASELVAA
jgi:hypothetical protein